MFEDSRRLVMERVCDAQVVWTGNPVTVAPANRYPGAPAIEEVEVWLEHVGRFDGEFRTFSDVMVRPIWRLQRVAIGPWRVAEAQSI